MSLARRTTKVALGDDLPAIWRKRPAELVTRLTAGTCELCGSRTGITAHHVRRLKDLHHPDQAAQPEWAKQMAARHRKTLIVCRTCHEDIHSGEPQRQNSWNKTLESRVQ